jgi:hypothetical protein
MSYRIWNTALDHTKRFLHRKASKMQMEPVLAGRRLRLRSSMTISDELFDHNKANLELYKGWGVVDWERVGEEKKPVVDVEADTDAKKQPPSVEIPALMPEDDPPPAPPTETPSYLEPPALDTPISFDEDTKASPPAETTSKETKPQPKSPFKGKKS